MSDLNIEFQTVRGFGHEWKAFDQNKVDSSELQSIRDLYFSIFPWDQIDSKNAVGADFGCGSGRWARLVAPRVKHLHLVDASADAIDVAKRNLSEIKNVSFRCSSIENCGLADSSLDFAFSLGVLHHVPDAEKALRSIVQTLRPGAPFLVYLYYKLDGKPVWYKGLWKVSDLMRRAICRTPFRIRLMLSQLVALSVYFPLARLAHLLDQVGLLSNSFPLAFYRNRSFYIMQNDALDRLGTRLERRYSKEEVAELLTSAGLERIRFSDAAPFWCAVGFKEAQRVG